MKKSIFVLFIFITSIRLFAGWEITYRTNDPEGTINYEVMLIEDNIVKYTSNEFEFIIDTENALMTFILIGSNSYWTGKPDEFRAEMNSAMKKVLNDMIAQVPEDQRAMYAEMLGGMSEIYSSPKPEMLNSLNININKTNENNEIAGYAAEKYSILIDNKLKESVWISKNLDIGDDYDGRKVHEILSKIMPNVDNENLHEFSDAYLDLMENGLILKSVEPNDETIEAIKIVKRSIKKNELEIPERFSEISIDELLQHQMMESDSNGNDNDW